MAANTLTGLIPVIYEAATQVFRELTGMIMAVSRDATAESAALNQTIRSPIVPSITPVPIVYGNIPADEGEQVMDSTDITLTNAYQAPIKWNGEEQLSLGTMKDKILQYQFEEAFRGIINMVETDLCELYVGASRAYGTAGTAPFAASHADITAQLRKMLDDNGVPGSERSLVINTTAGANLRSLTGLNTFYASNTEETLRRGLLLPLNGFDIRESAQIQSHTKGAGTGYGIVAGGEAVGQTTLSLDGGTVNVTGIKAGDVATFAGGDTDANKYVVKTGLVATSGDIVIGKPGLKVVKVNADNMTIGDSYAANMAFHRRAIHLAVRQPKMPDGGDMATDVTSITDPVTGLTFQIAMYRLHRMVKIEVGMVWGAAVMNPQSLCLLLG